MDKEYIFSIIIAVYNSEPFLRETLDSVISQCTEGFFEYSDGHITDNAVPREQVYEIIAVDDGSTDRSCEILAEYAEKYPAITVIRKKNGGVATARNEGLRHARGKYINFLDSDDKLSEKVFFEVYNFFERHYDETDIVTVPLVFFDAVEGPHWQNYKFKRDGYIANLYNEYDCPLMFVNASFFKSECREISFSKHLVCGEDMRFICEILADKMTLGLLPRASYFYRRRSVGELSLIQSSKTKRGWYFDYFTHLIDWAHEFCIKRWGYMPAYFQSLLVCDLKWRFKEDSEQVARRVLGREYQRYKEVLYSSLRYFDDTYIINQRQIYREHKCLMLTAKYGRLPDRIIFPDDIRLRFGNTLIYWLSSCYATYEFLNLDEQGLYLEGVSSFIGVSPNEQIETEIELYSGGKTASVRCTEVRRDKDEYRHGELLLRIVGFKCQIPRNMLNGGTKIVLTHRLNGEKIIKKNIRYGRFATLSDDFKNSYIQADGICVKVLGYALSVEKCSLFDRLRLEYRLLSEMRSSERLGAPKAVIARLVLKIYKLFRRRKILLISDRVNKAGDNGEALFRYLSERKKKKFSYYFVIDKASADFKRLSKIGRVIDSRSRYYKLVYLASDVIASSSADTVAFNPFAGYYAPYRDIVGNKKNVFLQHGVTKDDLSSWVNRHARNFSGITVSSERERESFLRGKYHYGADEIWLTGLSRYDRLYKKEPKFITVMPTWRMYLSRWSDAHEGIWIPSAKFRSSDYFLFYNSLINDKRIIKAAAARGYTLAFMPHPNILPYIDLFDKSPGVVHFGMSDEYRDVYAESALVLTDYSSLAFDFAYLYRPVIYTQFDKERFFGGEHAYRRGYFDYERDGFGDVVYDYESTVAALISHINSGCQLKGKYKERIDTFFTFRDGRSCSRIVKKIEELMGDNK